MAHLPPGFEPVAREELRGFFVVEPEASIQGIIMQRHARADEEGFYYRVKLTQPCERVRNFDKEIVTCKAGDIVAVDEKADLTRLSEYVGREVWLCATERQEISGGRTIWRFDLAALPEKTAKNKPPF